jgi:hypothetical protein
MTPRFIDRIDLGPGGAAYTGVGFTRVQQGNLCGNPEAPEVVAVVYGVFAALLLGSTIILVLNFRCRRGRKAGEKRSRFVFTLAAYAWGIISGMVPWVDLYTDITVLAQVWGAWPMWVILVSVVSPYVVAGYYSARDAVR